jgi:riboflavin synthase
MQESFKKTNFNSKKTWDYFNIERCLKVGSRLDWHMVSGHIDCIWKVLDIENIEDESIIIKIKFDEKYNKFIIEKWSITINWVSLTIIEAWNNFFTISLIPLTREITNLWDLKVWNTVNLEFDMIAKYVAKLNS